MTKKRDINIPQRLRVERKRISLDTAMRDGKLKSPKTDIGTIWSDLEKINRQEEISRQKKIKERKQKLANAHKEIKKHLKNVTSVVNNSTFLSTRYNKLVKPYPLRSIGILIIISAIVLVLVVFVNDKPDISSTLGAQDTTITNRELVAENPEFDILTPAGKTLESLGLKRVSPQNSAPSFVYVDSVDGATINVSQQQLPENLKTNQSVELEKLAKDFQATNIIQIDDNMIYHGYSEKGNRQSIILIKSELLILISVQGKLSDDSIASYVLSLKK